MWYILLIMFKVLNHVKSKDFHLICGHVLHKFWFPKPTVQGVVEPYNGELFPPLLSDSLFCMSQQLWHLMYLILFQSLLLKCHWNMSHKLHISHLSQRCWNPPTLRNFFFTFDSETNQNLLSSWLLLLNKNPLIRLLGWHQHHRDATRCKWSSSNESWAWNRIFWCDRVSTEDKH